MSECRICREHGYPGILIAWDSNIKTKNGRFVPLEPDKTTPHKHYEPSNNTTATTTQQPTQPDITTASNVSISEALAEIRKLANTLVVSLDLLQARIERQ